MNMILLLLPCLNYSNAHIIMVIVLVFMEATAYWSLWVSDNVLDFFERFVIWWMGTNGTPLNSNRNKDQNT